LTLRRGPAHDPRNLVAADELLVAARAGDQAAFARLIGPHRRELRALCYRMSGSLHDADDLLQESLLRAWKGLEGFEQRSSLRTWLYRVATTACLDALEKKSARRLPMDLGPPVDASAPMGPPLVDARWLEPCPEELYRDDRWSREEVDAQRSSTPEERYSQRESVTLAFLASLQLLPARQRAVLILRDVVGWQAAECAELLDVTVAAVNSILQRARDTMAARANDLRASPPDAADPATSALLARYVQAWERADVPALVALLHEEATLAMPPLSAWLRGAAAIGVSLENMVLTPDAAGRFRLLAIQANGRSAFAAYRHDPESGELRAAGIHLLEVKAGRIASITAFLDSSLFSGFGLPQTLART
jgi:RNA polymerase sigma-70 factor, ECF subfamily